MSVRKSEFHNAVILDLPLKASICHCLHLTLFYLKKIKLAVSPLFIFWLYRCIRQCITSVCASEDMCMCLESPLGGRMLLIVLQVQYTQRRNTFFNPFIPPIYYLSFFPCSKVHCSDMPSDCSAEPPPPRSPNPIIFQLGGCVPALVSTTLMGKRVNIIMTCVFNIYSERNTQTTTDLLSLSGITVTAEFLRCGRFEHIHATPGVAALTGREFRQTY